MTLPIVLIRLIIMKVIYVIYMMYVIARVRNHEYMWCIKNRISISFFFPLSFK